jgi:predicted RNase H-like HicB family nuclease
MINISPAAQALAMRPYSTIAFRDFLSNGEPIYMAYDPDLRGVKTQADTMQEAIDNLRELRAEWIQLLLEDGLPVAEPGGYMRVVAHDGGQTVYIRIDFEDFWP